MQPFKNDRLLVHNRDALLWSYCINKVGLLLLLFDTNSVGTIAICGRSVVRVVVGAVRLGQPYLQAIHVEDHVEAPDKRGAQHRTPHLCQKDTVCILLLTAYHLHVGGRWALLPFHIALFLCPAIYGMYGLHLPHR